MEEYVKISNDIRVSKPLDLALKLTPEYFADKTTANLGAHSLRSRFGILAENLKPQQPSKNLYKEIVKAILLFGNHESSVIPLSFEEIIPVERLDELIDCPVARLAIGNFVYDEKGLTRNEIAVFRGDEELPEYPHYYPIGMIPNRENAQKAATDIVLRLAKFGIPADTTPEIKDLGRYRFVVEAPIIPDSHTELPNILEMLCYLLSGKYIIKQKK